MRIAVLQMCSGIDPAQNAATIEQAVQDAAAGGAVMLFTPEMSGLMDSDRKRSEEHVLAQEDDPVLVRLCEAARQHHIWLHIGSLALRHPDSLSLRVNRGFVIDNLGQIRAAYTKMHLFDVDLSTGESWRESRTYMAGERASLVDTPLGLLGLSICYDVRFPSLYSVLSQAGATILSVPAAFTVPTGKVHWDVLLRARAIENACYVIAAAQSGHHEDGRETYGHSVVIDPWGETVLDMNDQIGLGFADLDLTLVDAVRARIPVIAHRKAIPAIVTIA
jgi:deaminated glutathione amidase